MEANHPIKEATFDGRKATAESIRAISLEVQSVKFDSCYIGGEGWEPIIKALSQKQQLTTLIILQERINSITQIVPNSMKSRLNNFQAWKKYPDYIWKGSSKKEIGLLISAQ